MSSLECSKPFQCVVIHELQTEFAQVRSELSNLNATVNSLIQVCLFVMIDMECSVAIVSKVVLTCQ